MEPYITHETVQSTLDHVRQELVAGRKRKDESGELAEPVVAFATASEFERGGAGRRQFTIDAIPVWVFWVNIPSPDCDYEITDSYLVSVTGTDKLTARIHSEYLPDIYGHQEILRYIDNCISKGRETA